MSIHHNEFSNSRIIKSELLQYLDLIIERAKSVEWCFLIGALIHIIVYLVDVDGTKKCMR